MKIKTKKDKGENGSKISTAKVNEGKKSVQIVAVVGVIGALMVWVSSMGKKAEETVTIVQLSNNVYRNQAITSSDLQPYDMLIGEYEKSAVVNSNGSTTKRYILWEDANKVIGAFAAYSLQANDNLEYRDLVKSRVDNSDTVLHSFPGKDIIKLSISGEELNAFKTFLEPGDKLNITGSYIDTLEVEQINAYGEKEVSEVEVYKQTTIFSNIQVADLINSSGESILDIYQNYNELSVYEQAQLDNSTSFQASVEPNALLVALTPEEIKRYNEYINKKEITFSVSMPQRSN